jgi:16S rRNA (guanine527-N7)-methyltransferase
MLKHNQNPAIIPPKGPPTVTLPAEKLAEAIARHNLDIPLPQIAVLERYCEQLWQWNEKINLTRHTDYEKFVARDLVDSLAFAEFLEPGEKVLDVGSGGGVPGIVLAVLRPDLKISLVDSVGKKVMVLKDIVEHLKLDIPVIHDRAEELLKQESFNTLVVRAVAPLKKLLQWLQTSWQSFGRLIVIKGPAWVEERGEARHFGLLKNMELRKLKSYPIQGSDSESVLLQITPHK